MRESNVHCRYGTALLDEFDDACVVVEVRPDDTQKLGRVDVVS